MRLTCRFQPGSRRQFLVVAALVVVVLAAPASQTYAGAPPSAGRSFSTVSQLPAHLTLTVTDHGATCGLPANSTATWFLEFGGPGAERVFCSRNDRAAQVSYPDCKNSNVPGCVRGGLAGLTESASLPDRNWLAYQYYGSELGAAFPGGCSGACSSTIVPACPEPHDDGTFEACTFDFECDGLGGTCTPIQTSPPPASPGDPKRGKRALYDVVLGQISGSGGPVAGVRGPVLADEACQLVACGDGYLDPELGEACDEGPRNGASDAGCSCDCQVVTTTTPTTTTSTTQQATTGPTSPPTTVTTSPVTTTTVPCVTARCTLDIVLHGSTCANDTIPAVIVKTVDQGLTLIDRSLAANQKARLLSRALAKLQRVKKLARKAAKGKKPSLSTACAGDIAGAVDAIRSHAKPGGFRP